MTKPKFSLFGGGVEVNQKTSKVIYSSFGEGFDRNVRSEQTRYPVGDGLERNE